MSSSATIRRCPWIQWTGKLPKGKWVSGYLYPGMPSTIRNAVVMPYRAACWWFEAQIWDEVTEPVPGLPLDQFGFSDLTGQSVPSGDTATSQELGVLWRPEGAAWDSGNTVSELLAPVKSQNNCLSPMEEWEDSKRSNTGEQGGGQAELRTSPARGKSQHAQVRTEILVSKTPQLLAQNEQVPAERKLGERLKYFLQWLYSREKGRRQEDAFQKAKSVSASAPSQAQ